ncbi:glycerol channel [Elasticomyces elasticus]|uniref:Glycerol channel n=1 Tax=Elasticomyces elasticus TaxID=574655 RepID=A0AAN7W9Y3_9PEZI|nr:glycerol channel [Elasticomyces elasticus]
MATAQMATGTSDSIASKSSKDDHPNALGNLPTASPSNAAYMNENGQTTATKTTSDMKQTRGMLGLHPQAPIDEEHDYAEQQEWWWARTRIALREPFAEFFGTFILVLFGDAAVAQVLLSAGQTSAPGADGYGNYQSINWGWGLGLMLGIYVAGGCSTFELKLDMRLTDMKATREHISTLPSYSPTAFFESYPGAGFQST